jgi:hypothetical protein
LAAKSLMGDVAAVAGEARMMARLAVALEGIAAEEQHSTSVGFAAIEKSARHTCGADHVLKVKQQKLVSSTVEYDRSEGKKGASSVWLP